MAVSALIPTEAERTLVHTVDTSCTGTFGVCHGTDTWLLAKGARRDVAVPRISASAPVVIASSVGASMAAATGRPMQSHLGYAQNMGAWWFTYLSGTQSLAAKYSADFATWNAPTGSPFALTNVHASEGRNLSCLYANIASTDVLHVNCFENPPSGITYHSRFKLGSTWTRTNAEANIANFTQNVPPASSQALDSTNFPWQLEPNGGSNKQAYGGSAQNVDLGTSWAAGYGAGIMVNSFSVSSSTGLVSLGGGNMLGLVDNAVTNSTMTNLRSALNVGRGFSAGDVAVFGSNFTATDTSAWGVCGRTTTDIHAVALANNSNAYVHARFNGTTWSAGDAIPNLPYGTTSGIYLGTDGTNVWAFIFDTSKNLQCTKWTSGTGWSAWAIVIAARTNTPAYITGCYNGAGKFGLAWTEANAGNYDIVGATVSLVTILANSPGYRGLFGLWLGGVAQASHALETIHSTDTKVVAVHTSSHNTDTWAAKLGTVVIYHSTDTDLKGSRTWTHNTDSLVHVTVIRAHNTDSLLRATFSCTHNTNSLANTTVLRTHKTDTLAGGPALVSQVGVLTVTAANPRAYVSQVGTLAVTAAVPQAYVSHVGLLAIIPSASTWTQVHTTNTWVQYAPAMVSQIGVLTVTAANPRAYVSQVGTLAITTATPRALASQTGLLVLIPSTAVWTQTHKTDTGLVQTGVYLWSHFTDTGLKGPVTRAHATDIWLVTVATLPQVHSTNILLRATLSQTHTTSSQLCVPRTVGHQTNSLCIGTFTRTHNTDTWIIHVVAKTHNTNTLARATLTCTHNTDSWLGKTGVHLQTHNTDALKQQTYIHIHNTNTLVSREVMTGHATDTALRLVIIETHNMDTLLLKAYTRTHNTDALKRQTYTRSHNTNTLVAGQRLVTHTTNTWLANLRSIFSRTDSLLLGSPIRTHKTDTRVVSVLTRMHGTDTVGRILSMHHHRTDTLCLGGMTLPNYIWSLLRATSIRTHNTDIYYCDIRTVTHKTDNLRQRTSIRTHKTDTLKVTSGSLTHNTDTLLQHVPLAWHTTDTFRVNARSHTHQTNTLVTVIPINGRPSSPRVGTRIAITDASKNRGQTGTVVTTYPVGFLLTGPDRITPITGVTPTVHLSKNGNAWVPAVGVVSEVGGPGLGKGWYQLAAATADCDTQGEVILMATAPGAMVTWVKFDIVAYDPFAYIHLILAELNALADVSLTRAFASVASVPARCVIQAVKSLWYWRTAPALPLSIVNDDGTTAWQANVVTDPNVKQIRGMTPTTTP